MTIPIAGPSVHRGQVVAFESILKVEPSWSYNSDCSFRYACGVKCCPPKTKYCTGQNPACVTARSTARAAVSACLGQTLGAAIVGTVCGACIYAVVNSGGSAGAAATGCAATACTATAAQIYQAAKACGMS